MIHLWVNYTFKENTVCVKAYCLSRFKIYQLQNSPVVLPVIAVCTLFGHENVSKGIIYYLLHCFLDYFVVFVFHLEPRG